MGEHLAAAAGAHPHRLWPDYHLGFCLAASVFRGLAAVAEV